MAIKKGGLLEEKIPVDQCFQCCRYKRLGPGNSWLCPVSCIVHCLAVSLSPPRQDASSTLLSSSETQKRLQILPNVLGGRGRHCTWLRSILIDTGKKGQINLIMTIKSDFTPANFCACVCLVASLRPPLCDPMDCGPPSSPVHGILQARTLEWLAIPFSGRSFPPRERTCVSCFTCEFSIV